MPHMLDLPPELLEKILLELDPNDVASAAQTCHALHSIVYSPSDLFWRRLYLREPFDDPRTCRDPLGAPLSHFDWQHTLQRLVRARAVVNNPALARTPREHLAVAHTLLDLARHTPPLSSPLGDELSLNLVWLAALLRKSTFLIPPPSSSSLLTAIAAISTTDDDAEQDAQATAHLHALFGLTPADFRPRARTEARTAVYDFRRYRQATLFGPFLPDGTSYRVGWVHLRAVHLLMTMQIVPRVPGEPAPSSYTIFPMSLPFAQSIIPPTLDLDAIDDWAGVEGTWQCTFNFIDHRDLLVFNNMIDIDGAMGAELKTAIFESPDFAEVFGGFNVRLSLVRTEPDPAHPTRPILHFTGQSHRHRHRHNEDNHGHDDIDNDDDEDDESRTTLAGWVCVTPDGFIRWHFESGQGGDNIWSSEGVEVGNVRSPYGVLGIWTTVAHDIGDPVGPFWMHRIPSLRT